MNTPDILLRLKREIEIQRKDKRSLLYIADSAGIPAHRLYRFHHRDTPLPMEDVEKLFKFLTGETFILSIND